MPDAQQHLVHAQLTRLASIRQRDVAAVGPHEPETHYAAVKDRRFGMRTPDGR